MSNFFSLLPAALAATLSLAACSPKFDWREVRAADASFAVLMPAKPSTLARTIDLGGVAATMTMTAAEVDGVSFAVGVAELPDPAQAQAALRAMQSALVRNINGAILQQKSATLAAASGFTAPAIAASDIEASGAPNRGAQPWLLIARFAAKDRKAFQAVVLGPTGAVQRDAADTFLSSFKLN